MTGVQTCALPISLPNLKKEDERLNAIPGIVPNPLFYPEGCRFHPRCPLADNECRSKEPQIEEIEDGHKVSCWHYNKTEELRGKDSTRRTQEVKILAAKEKLLEVRNLKKYWYFPVKAGIFRKKVGYIKAVDDICFFIEKERLLAW